MIPKKMSLAKKLPWLVTIALVILILVLPESFFRWDAFNSLQRRTLAIFVFAVISWIFELLPSFVTSVVIVLVELLFLSDKGLSWVRLDNALHYQDIFDSFGAGILLLFVGGFFLARATEKTRLSGVLANIMLKPFGTSPYSVLLGIILITAVLSMFLSNTATTALMLSICLPLLRSLREKSRLRIGFPMAIAFAANIGGMGTPIGTPPNAIGLANLESGMGVNIGFASWMLLAVPYVLVLLFALWFYIKIVYKTKQTELVLKIPIDSSVSKQKRNRTIFVFALTVFLWLTDFWHGINSYIVAMIAIVLLLVLGVLDKTDLNGISWDVIWLMVGGIALGEAMSSTGVAAGMISLLPVESATPATITILITIFVLFMFFMSNFMSHTAASNFIVPLAIVFLTNFPHLEDSVAVTYMLQIVFASSIAMLLPISTPPNALAYSTEMFKTKDMLIGGSIMGLLGLVIAQFYLPFAIRILGF